MRTPRLSPNWQFVPNLEPVQGAAAPCRLRQGGHKRFCRLCVSPRPSPNLLCVPSLRTSPATIPRTNHLQAPRAIRPPVATISKTSVQKAEPSPLGKRILLLFGHYVISCSVKQITPSSYYRNTTIIKRWVIININSISITSIKIYH